jgi:phosphohistidine phosphatase SixA
MLVSHAPLLPRLASHLLAGEEDGSLLHFRTGTVACLSLDAGRWQVEWMVPPILVP